MGTAIAAAAVLVAVLAMGGCMSSNDGQGTGATDGRLGPALRRIVAERPDSVVGVLVRTTARIGAEQRAALEAKGLSIGSVVGDVVTGRIRAGAAPAVARLPFVEYVEAARRLRPAGPQAAAPRSN